MQFRARTSYTVNINAIIESFIEKILNLWQISYKSQNLYHFQTFYFDKSNKNWQVFFWEYQKQQKNILYNFSNILYKFVISSYLGLYF